MIHKLLEPMHPNTRAMNGLGARLAAALARPWQTSYVSPTLRTIEAVAYAIRGYDVYWSPVGFDEEQGERNPSSVAFRCYKATPFTHYERVPSHGVEWHALFPAWAHRAECGLRNEVQRLKWRLAAKMKSDGGAGGRGL